MSVSFVLRGDIFGEGGTVCFAGGYSWVEGALAVMARRGDDGVPVAGEVSAWRTVSRVIGWSVSSGAKVRKALSSGLSGSVWDSERTALASSKSKAMETGVGEDRSSPNLANWRRRFGEFGGYDSCAREGPAFPAAIFTRVWNCWRVLEAFSRVRVSGDGGARVSVDILISRWLTPASCQTWEARKKRFWSSGGGLWRETCGWLDDLGRGV